MANRFTKGLGGAAAGAASGAALGSIIPGVGNLLGAGIGGLIGGIAGGSQHGDPEITSKEFSDINLEKDYPELYQEILKNQQVLQQLQGLYDARKSGLSDAESSDLRRRQSDLMSQLGNAGIAGTPIGQQMLDAQYNDAFNAMRDHAEAQKLALASAIASGEGNIFNMKRAAIGDIAGQNQNDVNMQMAQNQASNQLWNGLLTAGLGGLAQQYNNAQAANQVLNGGKIGQADSAAGTFNNSMFNQNYNPSLYPAQNAPTLGHVPVLPWNAPSYGYTYQGGPNPALYGTWRNG